MTAVEGFSLVMASTLVVQLLSFSLATTSRGSPLLTGPQPLVLEIGTNFTATCWIGDAPGLTVDDLYWTLSGAVIPKEHYRKINGTVSVTVPVTGPGNDPVLLLCQCNESSSFVRSNRGMCQHGIIMNNGYRPRKPENLSCQALQNEVPRSHIQFISPQLNCSWDAAGPQTRMVPVSYTLHVVSGGESMNCSARTSSCTIKMNIFPNHFSMDIWVEAENQLGTVESEHIKNEAGWFVKTKPPSRVQALSQEGFATTLLITWTHPIPEEYLRLIYEIRFCAAGSPDWHHVPLEDTAKSIQSFRLQNLKPDTLYTIEVRCQYFSEGQYWSNWSHNVTKRTPEAPPSSKPDLWIVVSAGDHNHKRRVQFLCKDPVSSNGRIKRFDYEIREAQRNDNNFRNASATPASVHRDAGRNFTALPELQLADDKPVKVLVTAVNGAGRSPQAELALTTRAFLSDLHTVRELKVWPEGGRLWVQWTPPPPPVSRHVSEYVLEWVSGEEMDWQRESRGTNRTSITGTLTSAVRYNVSVYPVFSGRVGRPTTLEAYLEEGVPLKTKVPDVKVKGKPGRNHVDLFWDEIPLKDRRGFITNYTIFYKNGTTVYNTTVPGSATSCTLESLLSDTKYEIWLRVSTVRGFAEGNPHSITTQKYETGEFEGIVAGVTLGFLFIVLVMMLLCLCKEDVIKKSCWPWIPNPGESTIGNWSPDYPLKVEMPRENPLSGICVLDADECEVRSVPEEDKAALPLKRDKYLSEEHSSGIGGSSCMSSPRQSVSDSDEGGDPADTTASTVQYSSVVASSGYKGQTPSCPPQPQQQPQQQQQQQVLFSRSESTQPLLEPEDGSEGPRQQEALEPLDFCPLVEDCEQGAAGADGCSAEWIPTAPLSNYMPQLGGYRPQ